MERVFRLSLFQGKGHLPVRSDREDYGVEALLLPERPDILDPLSEVEDGAAGLREPDILLDLLLIDPEGGDDVAHDTARPLVFLIDMDLRPGPCEEEGCGDSRGTGSDDGDLFPAVLSPFQRRKHGLIAVSCGDELIVSDLHGSFVVIPRAGSLTAVGTDPSRHKGKRILIQNHFERLPIGPLLHEPSVACDILVDRAAVPAGHGIAVDEGDGVLGFSIRDRLDRL